jgi:hypothetical protein
MTLRISHTDKIASVLIFAFTGVVFYLTRDFPSGYGATGPAFFPRLIVVLMSVFAFVQLVKAFRKEESRSQAISPSTAKTVGIAAAIIIAYVLVMPYLGFLVGTIVFLLVSMVFSGVRDPRKLAPVSVGVSLVLFYIFGQFLRVPLPESSIFPVNQLLPALMSGGVGIV